MNIGVDVGGTNTDAVAVRGRQVLAEFKHPTSSDVLSGVIGSIRALLERSGIEAGQVDTIMIGTTHFTNAVVEAKHLARTAAIRLAGSATKAIPPMLDWPPRLRRVVDGGSYILGGGYEFDGRPIVPLDEAEIRGVASRLREEAIGAAAVTSVFGPVNASDEERTAELLAAEHPEMAVSLSTRIGRMGLIERENATILNSSLRPLADRIVNAFQQAIADLGIEAPMYLSQNDGTLMGAEQTRLYPVSTFASGPTNSMRGAATLSGLSDCAVIDVGGTTTDIGILRSGFPREAPMSIDIGGVRTNFRMPDLVSVGIGGGSIVRTGESLSVGPDSVGYELTTRALVFGGDVLTATDIAVAAGLARIGDPSLVAHLDEAVVAQAMAVIKAAIAETLDVMKTSRDPIPVVLVGGGSILVDDDIPGASSVTRPAHAGVANAIGAALSQVGAQIDRVIALGGTTRQAALDAISEDARARCVEAGAEAETIRVVDVDEVPLAYLPSNAVRMSLRVVGDLSQETRG
ncbi:MAG TPA: hydantoinase/oxoprolinase family protein [Acidimicrobiia bacterium]|nr:hydantoinase/oxoprolinase family protein [Acidimicrobiia bacterium]